MKAGRENAERSFLFGQSKHSAGMSEEPFVSLCNIMLPLCMFMFESQIWWCAVWVPIFAVPLCLWGKNSTVLPLFHLISSVTVSVCFSVVLLVKEAGSRHTHSSAVCVSLTGHAGCEDAEDARALLFCGSADRSTTWEEDREGQGVLRSGRGRSNPVRQTMKVKWDGSGLKPPGCALARAAGVGTFWTLCVSHGELSERAARDSYSSRSSRGSWVLGLRWLLCSVAFPGNDLLMIQQSWFGPETRCLSGFNHAAYLPQSTNEEAPALLDGLTMSDPEHFDWLKESISLFPGKICDSMCSLEINNLHLSSEL